MNTLNWRSACLLTTMLLPLTPALGQAPSAATQPAQSQATQADSADLPHPQRDDGWRFNTYLENDSTWLKPNAATDRWYTNGIMIEATHQPQWAQDAQECLPFARQFGPANVALGYHAGQLMFTPRNIDLRQAQPDDRPFAGYLFGGAFIQRANDTTLDHFQVDLGIVGPSSLADDTQRFIHRNIAGDNPRGWRHQIRDEPAIQTYLRKKWRLDVGKIPLGDGDTDRHIRFQLIPEVGGALGTVYRHLEAGATMRVGFILPDDFGPGYIANPSSATGQGSPLGWSGYLFAGVAGKAVGHNVFLGQSDFRHNEVRVDPRPFIGQANAGITVNYRWEKAALEFTYSQTYMTREFRGQDGTPGMGAMRVALTLIF